jgi:cation diffusion facilitator family transporter
MAQTYQAEEKQKVALLSLLASSGLAVVKFAAALFSGSLALLSEAFHSLLDCGATAITLLAVRVSEKPADKEHPYGHAKVESVAALVETGLLFAVCAWVAYESVTRLFWDGHEVTLSWWLFAVLVASIAIDFNRSRALGRVAQKTSSDVLAADALHFTADMWSSAAVVIGLALVALGFDWGDSAAALVVSGFIAHAACALGTRTLNTLLDAAPEGITALVEEAAQQTDGVLSISRLRARPAGSTVFVDLAVDIPRTLPAPAQEKLRDTLTARIRQEIKDVDLALQLVPVALDTETAFEKVTHIAAGHGLLIHHLTVQDLDGNLAVSFDLEVDGNLSLEAAHETATILEADIRDGLGGHVEVESHIEPISPRLIEGHDPPAAKAKSVIATLSRLASKEKLLTDLHNIRIRQTGKGLFVHYHCRFAPEVTVEAAHETVDRIEIVLMKTVPDISRVVAHAEPLGRKQHKL